MRTDKEPSSFPVQTFLVRVRFSVHVFSKANLFTVCILPLVASPLLCLLEANSFHGNPPPLAAHPASRQNPPASSNCGLLKPEVQPSSGASPLTGAHPEGHSPPKACPPLLSHFSHVHLCATPWTVVRQAHPGKNAGRGLPCPPPGDLPSPGIKPKSPALQILDH